MSEQNEMQIKPTGEKQRYKARAAKTTFLNKSF